MSGDGGRRQGFIRRTLGDSGGQPPEYAPSSPQGGPAHPGHLQFTGPIHFDAVNVLDGSTVRITRKTDEGVAGAPIWLDDQEPPGRWTPHPHRNGVVPAP